MRILKTYLLTAAAVIFIVANLRSQTLIDVSEEQFIAVSEGACTWADYDKDGDPDALIAGLSNSDGVITRLYRNDGNNVFVDIGASLQGVRRAAVAWGDYDNDGDLDLAISGTTSALAIVPALTKIYRNDNGVFTGLNISLTNLTEAAVSWCDWDNDGDLDLSVIGSPDGSTVLSRMYRNDLNNVFTEVNLGIDSVGNTRMAWGDYDNDGDQDLIVCGNSSGVDFSTRLYRNNGSGTFSKTGVLFAAVTLGSVAWGDYDNDNDLDVLLTGSLDAGGGNVISRIYRNDGNNTFTDIYASLTGVYLSTANWSDLDNDGDLDIFISGALDAYNTPMTKIYRNNGNNQFSDMGLSLIPCVWSSAAIEDCNNDNKKDILFTGHAGSKYVTCLYTDISAVLSQSAYPNGITAGGYFSLSWPFDYDVDITGYFGPQQLRNGKPINWRVLAMDVQAQQFIDTKFLSDGNAYLIFDRTGEASKLFTTINGVSVSTSTHFNSWILKPGWNFVPWPYVFSANVISRNATWVGSIWWMNGKNGWEPVTELKPFGGYMIRNKTGGNLALGSAISWTRSSGKSLSEPLPLNVRFVVESGDHKDAFNYIGTTHNATGGNDDFDESEPLIVGEGVQAYFVNESGRSLSYDIRSSNNQGNEWDLIVENTTNNRETRLSWNKIGDQSGVSIVIFDVTNNKRVDAESAAEYAFEGSKKTKFKIVAGEYSWVFGKANEIEASLPKEFKLSQNYPNPFNPTTSITFDVPRSGGVKIKVYNILGQEVATIANGFFETGRNYEAVWNGRDDLGREMASGMYIYRLEAGRIIKTKKMLLIK